MLLIAGLVFYFTGNTKVGGILLGVWGALTVLSIIGSITTVALTGGLGLLGAVLS